MLTVDGKPLAVFKIIHYQFDDFTADRLIKYLAVIYPNIDVRVQTA